VKTLESEVFGKYHLLEKIATGGMAEVWRARFDGTAGFEKILVIKKILATLAESEEFITLFRDEAKMASRLAHVNIVQTFELDQVEGQHYMAMEYVHGLDLSRLASRARRVGDFPIGLALFITCEVLKALAFAHDHSDEKGPLNVIHCDISPQNILISYAGEVKLTDFGISRAAFQSDAGHKVIRGKYAYMSPEQVGGKTLTRHTDLFSLGIVVYEILTGTRLFKAKNRDETLARVRRAEVPSPRGYRPEISEALEAFLLKALARKAEDRYASAGEMLNALSALVIAERHRATNNDLAAFMRTVIERAAATLRGDAPPAPLPSNRPRAPSAVVVLAAEAARPLRSIAKPRTSLAALTQTWLEAAERLGAEVWEQQEGSMLLVWVARGGLRASLSNALLCASEIQQTARTSGYQVSAGLAPGVARVAPDTRRPAEGWELAGPFYLARWMMNLSAHRGRVLLTEVGARQVPKRTSLLGRIPIQGNRYINLYELS